MHQADAEHRAGAGQPRVGERGPVVRIEDIGQAAAGDGPAQQLLTGAGVLVGEEPPIDQQPGMVIDDEEQPSPDRGLDPGPGHPRADEHVGDPPFVGPFGLVTAEHLRLGSQCLAVQTAPA
jgi:hypothetical protein